VGKSLQEIERFKEQMKQILCMSDLGNMLYYLRIEVKQLRHGTQLSHRSPYRAFYSLNTIPSFPMIATPGG
jgi:hypothetical protein